MNVYKVLFALGPAYYVVASSYTDAERKAGRKFHEQHDMRREEPRQIELLGEVSE